VKCFCSKLVLYYDSMNTAAEHIKRVYLALLFGNTLAASMIWGINTIFLLDAGLSNFEAFAANAFFTAGMMLFEVPTGVVADTRGRRTSFLLGSATLALSTLLYLMLWQIHAPFLFWAVTSLLLGLGFTFFSGATEAWLVDALKAVKFKGELETVFARGQVASGVAMLIGSVGGGILAQFTSLGIPYIVRAVLLALTFIIAFFYMKDLGFTPLRSAHPLNDVKKLLKGSLDSGLRNPPVRWLMLAAPFTAGIGIYVFYALQPYLLQLYGNPKAYGIAGLVAAIVAGAQILGGLIAPQLRRVFKRRTSALIFDIVATAFVLLLAGLIANFWIVLGVIVIWGLLFAAITPIRQAYLNSLIESKQRATVLSFDSLMGSAGGVVIQPGLGKAADIHGYAASYILSSLVQLAALPFLIKARLENTPTDTVISKTQKI
jgi:MFS family permease